MVSHHEDYAGSSDGNREVRILVVDDEEGIVNFLRMGLRNEGFAVKTATDGETALGLVDHFHPHLVILDLMLPGASELELAQILRSDPDLGIIMLTARDLLTDRVAGLTVGADDYMAYAITDGP